METLGCGSFPVWPGLLASVEPGARRHVSDDTISADELAYHQKRQTEADLRELISLCRDRYCFAHELIKPHASLPDTLFDQSGFDLAGFYIPWSQFCTAYREMLFSPQIGLFEEHREYELHRWRTVVEKECFARFTREPEWVRAVLESAHLIQDRSPERELYIGHLFEDIIQDIKERIAKQNDQYEN